MSVFDSMGGDVSDVSEPAEASVEPAEAPGDPNLAHTSAAESASRPESFDSESDAEEGEDYEEGSESGAEDSEGSEPELVEYEVGDGIKFAVKDGKFTATGLKDNGEDLGEIDGLELARGYMRNNAATRKFQRAAAMSRKATGVLEAFQTGNLPQIMHILQQVNGVDFDRLAEARMAQLLHESEMPEHERAMLQIRRQQEALQAEREQWRNEQRQAAVHAEAQVRYQQLSEQLPAAIRQAGIEPNAAIVGRVAEVMAEALEYGYEMTPADAVQALRERPGALPAPQSLPEDPDELIKQLGPDRLRAIQQAEARRVRAEQASQPKLRSGSQSARRQPRELPRISTENMNAVRSLFDS